MEFTRGDKVTYGGMKGFVVSYRVWYGTDGYDVTDAGESGARRWVPAKDVKRCG